MYIFRGEGGSKTRTSLSHLFLLDATGRGRKNFQRNTSMKSSSLPKWGKFLFLSVYEKPLLLKVKDNILPLVHLIVKDAFSCSSRVEESSYCSQFSNILSLTERNVANTADCDAE